MKQVLALFLLLLLSSCFNQRHDVVLDVGTNLWPGYEPLHLAKYKKLYKYKFSFREYDSATSAANAYKNNLIDLASLTLDEAIVLYNEIPDFKIILIHDYSHGGDVLLSRPPYKSLKELAGKKIAVEPNAVGEFFFARAVEKAGMLPSDFIVIPSYVDEHVQRYEKGEVDAVIGFEPVKTLLQNKGANIIFSSRDIPGEIVDVLIARESVLKNHKEKIMDLTSTWFKATSLIKDMPEEIKRYYSKRFRVDIKDISSMYDQLIIPGKEANKQELKKDSKLHLNAIRLQKFLKKQKLINTENELDIFTNEYIK
jgi:NitT/TauT family transport system substrate-binding protein